MKGYLAIREGDILCIPQSSDETVKHMADLVRLKNFFIEFLLFLLLRFVN